MNEIPEPAAVDDVETSEAPDSSIVSAVQSQKMGLFTTGLPSPSSPILRTLLILPYSVVSIVLYFVVFSDLIIFCFVLLLSCDAAIVLDVTDLFPVKIRVHLCLKLGMETINFPGRRYNDCAFESLNSVIFMHQQPLCL